ncbi:hypothetical protein HF521_001378 [Silurus meridionalis]|uniref:Uncharacterized protein n=1 Tax=Silurus meridionalis TaxID=175797 RepID=A0A8T0B9D9_SILME|nr:hypothetical protein HF521_001378 [Silurus meridionalis]
MESPPDPTSEPGKSASEAASAVRESPLNLDALRKAEHQAPVRRHSCSSTNRAVSGARVPAHALRGLGVTRGIRRGEARSDPPALRPHQRGGKKPCRNPAVTGRITDMIPNY